MKRFRILRSRKRLVFQSKKTLAGLSKTKTEIDVFNGTIRWVSFFFFSKSYIVSIYFSEFEQKILIFGEIVSKGYRKHQSTNPLQQFVGTTFFWKYDRNDAHFWNWSGKNQFLSVKVSEELRKPHFTCPQQILKKKFEKKLTFPSFPDFEQSCRVFQQMPSCIGKKLNYSCQNCVLFFQRHTSRMKVFDENPRFLNQLTTFRSKKLTEFWARTIWHCHQNCFLWVQTNKLKKQVFEKVFYRFLSYREGLLIFDIKKSGVLPKPNSRCAKRSIR